MQKRGDHYEKLGTERAEGDSVHTGRAAEAERARAVRVKRIFRAQ